MNGSHIAQPGGLLRRLVCRRKRASQEDISTFRVRKGAEIGRCLS